MSASAVPPGPYDVDDVDLNDGVERVDLGSLLIPASASTEMQVQADQTTGVIAQVSIAVPGGGMQVNAFAAPKSGGMWDEIRPQIAGSISQQGGLVEEREGTFGIELSAKVRGEGNAMQAARFVGVDGPRWFLRAVLVGAAATSGEEAATTLESIMRGIVVVRGDAAMAVGAPLPMRLPDMSDAKPTAPAAERPRISMPARGPEITETR